MNTSIAQVSTATTTGASSTAKTSTKSKISGINFAKLLSGSTKTVTTDDEATKSLINELTALLAKLKGTTDDVDLTKTLSLLQGSTLDTDEIDKLLQTKTTAKVDSKEEGKTEDGKGNLEQLLSLLGTLINKIEVMQNLETTSDKTVATSTDEVMLNVKRLLVDNFSNVDKESLKNSEKSQRNNQVIDEKNSSDIVDLLQAETKPKEIVAETKIIEQKTNSTEQIKNNEIKQTTTATTTATAAETKQANKVETKPVILKEIQQVIESILVKAKADTTNTVMESDDISKLQGILKNLTQIVTKDETQKTSDTATKPTQVQEYVKPQIVVSNLQSNTNNDKNQNTNSDSESSKEDFKETLKSDDKMLRKISQTEDSTKSQSFNNFINRISMQSETVKTVATEPKVINRDNLANDVVKTVKFMATNDLKDLTVKIAPKELGEVVIKLTQEGNVMKATITTSNKEAFQIVNSSLQDINNKISSNNTSIQSFAVDVYNGESSFLKQGSGQNQDPRSSKKNSNFSFNDEEENSKDQISADNNLNILV